MYIIPFSNIPLIFKPKGTLLGIVRGRKPILAVFCPDSGPKRPLGLKIVHYHPYWSGGEGCNKIGPKSLLCPLGIAY